ncbi:hypothetical protein [Nostoc sp. PA-18-2419]|uniref:hypothetical protein n=1 Tax=Nostoc sp. PA-18-2419 TaxID=2575443 RepID=UPI00110830B3|nr:hypothetical protein [Nostoc sp. PA-18-2419]
MLPYSSDLMLSDLSKFGDIYNNLAYATENFSVFPILCQQNYQQNVTLKNYGLLRMPKISGKIS